MAKLDFTPARCDLALQAGDDAVFTCTFDSSLTGWTSWAAKVESKDGTQWSLSVNSSAQASQQITLTLSDTQTAAIPSGSRWQFWANDPDGNTRTLIEGAVGVNEDL